MCGFLFGFFRQFQISNQNIFPAPGEGVVSVGSLEGAVGEGGEVCFREACDAGGLDFRERGGGGVLVVRANFLTFVAAENIGRPCDDRFFFARQFFFLREIGFATVSLQSFFRKGAGRAGGEAFRAGAAGEGKGRVRREVEIRQKRANREVGAVFRVDEAVIFAVETEAREVGEVAVDEGRGVADGKKRGALFGLGENRGEAQKVGAIDSVIVSRAGVESDVCVRFLYFRFVGKEDDDGGARVGKERAGVRAFCRVFRHEGDGALFGERFRKRGGKWEGRDAACVEGEAPRGVFDVGGGQFSIPLRAWTPLS